MSIAHEIGTIWYANQMADRASRNGIGKTMDHRYRIGDILANKESDDHGCKVGRGNYGADIFLIRIT